MVTEEKEKEPILIDITNVISSTSSKPTNSEVKNFLFYYFSFLILKNFLLIYFYYFTKLGNGN